MTPALIATTERNVSRQHWLDAWHVSPSANRDYDFIDGLRGVAILMVIIGHHFYINPGATGAVRYIGAIFGTGGYGVTLFYALSGFLISWPFWKRKAAGSEKTVPPGYAQRRFWKIYPPMVLSILVFTPLYILDRADWSYLSIAARWLTGLGFLIPVSGKFNAVMWTLAVEVQFYVTLPLVFLALKRVSPRICLCVITALFLAVPVLMRCITKKVATFHPDIDTHYPSALDVFCLGVLIAGLDNLGFLRKKWVRWAIAGTILWPLVLLISAWIGLHTGDPSFSVNEIIQDCLKFAAACLLLFIAFPQQIIARLLCAPWLRWCGIISYEWYLFHQPILFWFREHLGPANGNPWKYFLIVGSPMALGLVLSAVIYRFFSLPILRRGRSRNPR